MGSDESNDEKGESIRDRIDDYVESIKDVPGVVPGTSGFGDAAYATVNVDFDYGNRDEWGDGNVCVAPEADDPVGREAYNHGLRIVRTTPQPRYERFKLWLAPKSAYDDVEDGTNQVHGDEAEAAIDGMLSGEV